MVGISFLAGTGFSQPGPMQYEPGLVVHEYPRHAKQDSEENSFFEPGEFGDPIGAPSVTDTLNGWKHETERNAIAKGFLRVESAGVYRFRTNSFYDRNQLRINGEIVCHYMDGGSRVKEIELEAGFVPIESIGFVNGRGGSQGIEVLWQPPGQRELGPIPKSSLFHEGGAAVLIRKYVNLRNLPEPVPGVLADELVLVAKDFVIEIYHNGRRLERSERRMVLDRFGSTVEKVDVDVEIGDWLVFHVAHNRLRHGGTKYFGLTGLRDGVPTIVSRANSEDWSICDQAALSSEFIHQREFGTEARAIPIAKPWEEGGKFMKKYSGHDFVGDPVWGTAASTWIKFTVSENSPLQAHGIAARGGAIDLSEPLQDFSHRIEVPAQATDGKTEKEAERKESKEEEPRKPEPPAELAISNPKRWPVQVISAIYGTGGKNADVTEKVREFVEEKRCFFAANPRYLGADPNPYWNKGLRIVYLKDGVRREQRRNENEHILPESFYGPHDAAELERWILGTRWKGPVGEIQFHPNGHLAGPGVKSQADWKALSANRLSIHWPREKKPTEYKFDYVWSSFRVSSDAKNEYRIMR